MSGIRAGLAVALAISLMSAATFATGASGSQRAGVSAKAAGAGAASLKSLKSLESLEPRALRRWPDSFGGLWLGKGAKVFVAFTARGERRAERLAARFPKPDKLHAVKVDDSLRALRELQGRMIADRASNPPVPRLQYDLNINVKANIVEAIVGQAVTQDLVAAFKGRYGEDVVVKQGPLAEPDVCNSRTDCPPFLRSGLRTDGSTGCSLAFGVLYSTVNERVDGILSAAHCGDPDANYLGDQLHNGVFYGEVVAEQQSGKVDAELHSVGSGFFSFFPLIYRSDSDQAAHVGKVGTYAGLPIGLKVCKAGITTGETCGQVLSKNFSPSYVTNAMDFIETDYCSDHGDSGAGAYHPYKKPKGKGRKTVDRYEAVGVHSGGAKDTLCSDPQWFALFGHIEFVQSALGVTVLKNPN